MITEEYKSERSPTILGKITEGPSLDIFEAERTAIDIVMASMFESAKSGNRPLVDWNVSSLTNMAGMFHAGT